VTDLERNGEEPSRPAGDGERRLPRIYNWLSISGAIVALIGSTACAFFFAADLTSRRESGYMGVTYLPALALALVGFALVAAGFFREVRRRKLGRSTSFTGELFIDVRDKLTTTRFVATFVVGAVAVTFGLLVIGAGSMRIVEFTSSNAFCGEVCHSVMHPEAAVYANSPHARIDCVECHVGHGGDSFIRAKLNGARQLYEFAIGKISRPIPTPIRARRPSREMCESCHWPERFIDYKVITRKYTLNDEENTSVGLRMMIKVGGGENGLMQGSGIHYHMVVANKVEFIARDPQRQQIAWVRITRRDGTLGEYNDSDEPLTDTERETLPVHTMECLDCHSRPAHQFEAPVDSVNQAIATGRISRDLPYIKVESVRLLSAEYPSQAAATKAIDAGLTAFYRENHSEVLEEEADSVQNAIEVVQSIYRSTIFPEMAANWMAHPNNIGHWDSPGCFRCHNDVMESEDGDAIFTDCTKCHVNLAQGDDITIAEANFEFGASFVHPEDGEAFDEFTLCSDCHTGGIDLYE